MPSGAVAIAFTFCESTRTARSIGAPASIVTGDATAIGDAVSSDVAARAGVSDAAGGERHGVHDRATTASVHEALHTAHFPYI
jgi:hypothetical protein